MNEFYKNQMFKFVDEIILKGKDKYPNESNFFKELMFLCAKYGVIIYPVLLENDEDKVEYKDLKSNDEIKQYPSIEFNFPDGTAFTCDMINIDSSYYNAFVTYDDNGYIGINGIPFNDKYRDPINGIIYKGENNNMKDTQ